MKTKYLQVNSDVCLPYAQPTREEIDGLKAGEEAAGVLGFGTVTRIYARGIDSNGRAYACGYLHYPTGLTVSQSWREGEIVRSVRMTGLLSSVQVDRLERQQ